MVGISFSVFESKLKNREKQQTIRKFTEFRFKQFKKALNNPSRYPLQLWWKMRTPGRYKFYDGKCVGLDLFQFGNWPFTLPMIHHVIKTDSGDIPRYKYTTVPMDMADQIAVMDGFNNYEEMWNYFEEQRGPKFHMETWMIIRWEEIKQRVCEYYDSNTKLYRGPDSHGL